MSCCEFPNAFNALGLQAKNSVDEEAAILERDNHDLNFYCIHSFDYANVPQRFTL